jgi:acyl-CoA thioesterase II
VAVLPGSDVVDLWRLEATGEDRFRGSCHAGAPLQVFGGQVAAQALMAAGQTVHRLPHSMHGTFLRPGDSRLPVAYTVERLFDGRTYAARAVHARQRGQTIFSLTASFKHPEGGHDRQSEMPAVPAPEDLPDPYLLWAEVNPEGYALSHWRHAVALRFPADDHPPLDAGSNHTLVWMKVVQPLPADPLVQAAALTYCSDLTLAHTAALDIEPYVVFREGPRRTRLTSLNHAVWFHRPFRADEWLLFTQRSLSATDGRGLSMGEFWSRDGRLVASAVQESVLRLPYAVTAGDGPR